MYGKWGELGEDKRKVCPARPARARRAGAPSMTTISCGPLEQASALAAAELADQP